LAADHLLDPVRARGQCGCLREAELFAGLGLHVLDVGIELVARRLAIASRERRFYCGGLGCEAAVAGRADEADLLVEQIGRGSSRVL
jgi:hypothetical protein